LDMSFFDGIAHLVEYSLGYSENTFLDSKSNQLITESTDNRLIGYVFRLAYTKKFLKTSAVANLIFHLRIREWVHSLKKKHF
jgi:hypothetical protein